MNAFRRMPYFFILCILHIEFTAGKNQLSVINHAGTYIRTAIHLLVETTTLFRRIIRDGQFGIRLVDNQQTIKCILLDGEVIEVEGVARVRIFRNIYNALRARKVIKERNGSIRLCHRIVPCLVKVIKDGIFCRHSHFRHMILT